MLILGLLLIALAVIAVVGALFVSSGTAELLGMDLSALAIFLIGAGTVAVLVLGLRLAKFGTKRELRARREHKKLSQLSEKLDTVEAERRKDAEPEV